MLTKEKIIQAAEAVSLLYGRIGSFVCTDGEWSSCSNPAKFKEYLERMGFEVVKCYATSFSSAIAETADGYQIAYNGHCRLIDRKV